LNRPRNTLLPNWLSLALSIAFVLSSIVVIIFAYLTFGIVWNRPVNPVEAAAAEVSGIDLSMAQEGTAPVPTLLAGQPTPTLIPTREGMADSNRINILAMGIDRRPGEPFISRTDSIMIISVNPDTQKISILSVPRDLYVVIPGKGRDRINTAFVYGSTGNNPAGGALLAMQTIEYNLGIPIDHYLLVDFSAVTNGIDALGGIDVYVPYEIYDPTFPDMNYGYDPFYVAAGQQHFDGTFALKYARTRHADNDFYRASRQQQVLLAARDKAFSLGIGGLIARAPILYQQLEQGIRTDLSLDEMMRIATTVSEIPKENIRNEVIDSTYVTNFTTEQGASVLIMINEKVSPLIESMFYGD